MLKNENGVPGEWEMQIWKKRIQEYKLRAVAVRHLGSVNGKRFRFTANNMKRVYSISTELKSDHWFCGER